ncbi:MAG: sialidase family protein [Myxococcota bacterium]
MIPCPTVLLALLAAACSRPPVFITEPGPPLSTTACASGTCIDDPAGEDVRNGWVNVAIGPDGAAWVVWAQADGPDVTGVWLARSPSPGAPLSEPVAVPVAVPPSVGTTEKPAIAVDAEGIALAYTGLAPERHGDARALYLQRGVPEGDAVAFSSARVIDRVLPDDPPDLVMEQARVATAPDGELWLLWKRQIYGEQDHVWVARGDEDFAPRLLSAELPTEHDCSPPDLRFGYGGELLVAVRGNIDGWLQTLAVRVDPATGAATVRQISDDDWHYDPDVCPEDGPRIAELADGTLYAAWMAPAEGTWRLFSATSADGEAWSTPGIDHAGDVGLGETWVAVAPTEAGPFYTAVEGLDQRTRLLVRDAPGDPAEEAWLVADDGSDVVDVEIASSGGRTVAVGVGEGRVLWLIDL